MPFLSIHFPLLDVIPYSFPNIFLSAVLPSKTIIFGFTNTTQYELINLEINKLESGKRLKEFRKEKNITQTKLASVLNTVHPVITNYEKGKFLISTAFLYTISKKYNISADYLLGKTNNPKYLK